MDWTKPLREQQADFIQRLKLGYLLNCEIEGQHSELTVISGNHLNQLRNFCWEMVRKYKPDNPKLYFINNIKGKLGEEIVKLRLGKLVTEVNYKKQFSGDGKVDFTLISNSNIGIQVKVRQGRYDKVQWYITKEEIEANAVLVCILNQEEIDEAQTEYNLISAGFIPTNRITLTNDRGFVKIDDLFYSGGLNSYLSSLINSDLNEEEENKQKLSKHIENQVIVLFFQYMCIGNIASMKGYYQDAFDNYSKAIELKSNVSEPYLCRAYILYLLGDIRGAINDYTKAIVINPVNAKAYNNRGVALLELGSKLYGGTEKAAIEDFSNSIKLNPYNADIYFYRGDARWNIGDKEGAIDDYNKGLTINPNDAQAYCKRGSIYYDKGNIKQAIEDYSYAIKINPSDANAYYNRSIFRYELGDKEGAIIDYNQALIIDPHLPPTTWFQRINSNSKPPV